MSGSALMGGASGPADFRWAPASEALHSQWWIRPWLSIGGYKDRWDPAVHFPVVNQLGRFWFDLFPSDPFHSFLASLSFLFGITSWWLAVNEAVTALRSHLMETWRRPMKRDRRYGNGRCNWLSIKTGRDPAGSTGISPRLVPSASSGGSLERYKWGKLMRWLPAAKPHFLPSFPPSLLPSFPSSLHRKKDSNNTK